MYFFQYIEQIPKPNQTYTFWLLRQLNKFFLNYFFKTDNRRDINEILLKVALNTITLTLTPNIFINIKL